ncbi:UDP-glucose 4-epimerase GalE [Aurantimonas marina]|uniref:UDP-glucose 4-epimerase GalE n=1 Tax=Aurantimonas marina TaxID=2780508 RepID=UPI0019D09868|nr:UDP-glucose 4-epimerase GalE [Aurantimonas marina]
MTILVTGGAGYIGGHMVLGLLDAGEDVVVLDNMTNGTSLAVQDKAPLIVGDIGDYETVSSVLRTHEIEAVIHFAAQLITPDLYEDPLQYYLANTTKSRTLLAAASDHGIRRIIFSGTAAVYGDPEVNPVPETARINPISPYGTSKLITEYMLRDLSAVSDLNYVTLRYFNVAGADPRGRYGQSTTKTTLLVQIAAQAALGLRPRMEIFGDDYPTIDGTCVRDYIHVTDLIDAHLAALRHLRGGGDNLTLNCGYGRGYSVKQILEMAMQVSGNTFEIHKGPRRRGDAVEVVADASRIREVLGWTPRFDDVETIVSHAVNWEKTLQRRREFDRRL